jgi:Tol biopolymer transport system component
VLDFGLAKAFEGDPSSVDIGNSPTLSQAATMQGVILGTAAYMSPEQARGRAVDKRTDIWAFGCVLYELLTGKQAFHGEDVTDILAAVVRAEPDWTALPPSIPTKIRDLLRRCLQKDKRLRLRDAGDAQIEIHEALAAPSTALEVTMGHATRNWRERIAWGAAAAFALIASAFAIAFLLREPKSPEAMRFFVPLPETWTLAGPGASASGVSAPLSVSPDGRRIVLLARNADGKYMLWVRPLDSLTPQPLAGTQGALDPFWSPDSRFIGFFADGKLKKIEVSGGPPIALCDAPGPPAGGTWNRDGVIVFAPTTRSALQKVSASGGVPTAATVLGQRESAHWQPIFLPDGRHFLYHVNPSPAGGSTYLASIDSAERKLLLSADSTNVLYSQGHLLFLRETTLMAQPFDTRRLELTGEAFPIAEQIQVQGTNPYGVFSTSENGVLVYETGTGGGSQLVWFDRTGKQIGVVGDSAAYADLELSPDGKRASVSIQGPAGKGRDIWLYDVARGLRTRFTFDGEDEQGVIWSPDGKSLIFGSKRKEYLDLYQKASSGAGTEQLLLEDTVGNKYPTSWSPDGRSILYFTGVSSPRTGADLFVLPLSGDRKPVPFLNTQFNEIAGHFSPDGRWVAYYSNESGRYEVYVASFPGPGGKWQISTAGGKSVRWRRDGTEIFYLDPDNKLMAATVNSIGSSLEVRAVKPLFQTRAASPNYQYPYDVSADGQRFLINTLPEQTTSAPITVLVNWTAGLKK